jgi:hypothetical protein
MRQFSSSTYLPRKAGVVQMERSTIPQRRCIRYIQRMHKSIKVRPTTKKSEPIMHFDIDSYDSQSIANNLQNYIKPPKLSDMRILKADCYDLKMGLK